MSEHLSTQSLEQYRQRALSPAELLVADDHLAACEHCRARAGEDGQSEQLLRALDANLQAGALGAEREHLPFEQIAALVDNGLDRADREVAESHLELCRMCADEADDLRAFRSSLANTPTEQVAQKARATTAPALTEKFPAFRRLFTFPLQPRFAAALALLFVSLTAALLWWQSRPAPEVGQTTRPPATTETPRPEDANIANATPTPAASDAATQILVALEDGSGQVTLDAQGAIKGLEALSPDAQRAVKNALTSGRVEESESLARLNGRGGTLMGSPGQGETFSLLSPVGVVVRADRPRLRWRPLPEASAYTVTVLDSDLKIVATSPSLSTTAWTPPRALERGRVYKWQVSALKDGEEIVAPAAPAPEARFRILDRNTNDELRRLEKANARSHLARGVLYAQAGLLVEAERELRALVAANPQSAVARNLLRSVQRRQK